LIAGKEDVYKSRGLIELKPIQEIETTDHANFALELDFVTYKKVLVGEYHFNSFEKTLDELKKKLQNPVQMGLF
jgi:hypothetical protein